MIAESCWTHFLFPFDFLSGPDVQKSSVPNYFNVLFNSDKIFIHMEILFNNNHHS